MLVLCEARPGLNGALFLFRYLSVAEGNEKEKSGSGRRIKAPKKSLGQKNPATKKAIRKDVYGFLLTI